MSDAIQINAGNPTQAQANNLKLGIAAAQTAYVLNNGGGLVKGEPLVTIQDSALIGVAGTNGLLKNVTDTVRITKTKTAPYDTNH